MIKQKTIIIAFACILLLSITTGYELYSGDTIEIELDKPYEYYSIVGNSSPVELTIQENGNFINITVGNYVNTSFELIFFDKDQQIIYQTSGGGGTRTRYVDKDVTTTEYVYVDKIIYKNQTVDDTEIDDPEPPVKQSKVYFYLFLGMIGLLIVLLIIFLLNFERGDKYE